MGSLPNTFWQLLSLSFSFETTASLEGSRGAIYQPSRPHRPWTVAGTCLLQTAVSTESLTVSSLRGKPFWLLCQVQECKGEKETGESGTSSRIFQRATTSCLILFAGFRSDFPWDYTYWTGKSWAVSYPIWSSTKSVLLIESPKIWQMWQRWEFHANVFKEAFARKASRERHWHTPSCKISIKFNHYAYFRKKPSSKELLSFLKILIEILKYIMTMEYTGQRLIFYY